MTIKDLLAKMLKGDTLTDEEKKLVQEYDPDATAAAARRKAEADAKRLADKLAELEAANADLAKKADEAGSAGKSEADKFTKQVEALSKQVEALTKAKADADATAARLGREQKIGQLRAKHGVKFVDGVDPALVEGAFARVFDGLETFDDEAEVKTRLQAFKAANKALIADTGHGTGDPAGDVRPKGLGGKPVEEMSIEERRADLKQRGIIG